MRDKAGGDHIVDIHVQSGAEENCPKQDVTFPLLSGDQVCLGPLGC